VKNKNTKVTLSLAQRIVYRLLSKLQYGKVTLIEKGSRQEFVGSEGHAIGEVVIKINSKKLFSSLLLTGTNGAAHSYIEGYWETDNLAKLIEISLVNEKVFQKIDNKFTLITRVATNFIDFIKKNNKNHAKRNILMHYDLSNEFFQLFLDKKMVYSCAIYESENTDLDVASVHKLKTICDSLKLTSSDHVLEIGSGWGGLAIFAAENYGCKVTTTTVSDKQFEHVKSEVKRLNLQDKVEVLNKDYRDLSGQYDKLVSVEMIEAVGHVYFETFFKKCNDLVRPGGLFFLQAITINDKAYEQAKIDIDFIKKYIFPGGCLPSMRVIHESITKCTQMQLLNSYEIGPHYVKTLSDWMTRFNARVDVIKSLGFTEQFIRTWQFYFCYCIAGFRQSYINNIHILWQKNT
jgi:cyclopropane-fatty-acyl-phospholipid synthase